MSDAPNSSALDPQSAEVSLRPLQARPITAWSTIDETQSVDYFRHRFQLEELPERATLTLAVWGVGLVRINNLDVDDEVLFPGWTDYRFQLRVATIDITRHLRPGANVISARVGDGWYRGRLGALGDKHIYGDTRGLLAQIEIEGDATRTVLSTDGWRCNRASHVTASLYDGWTFDARSEPAGWQKWWFDDHAWSSALPLDVDLSTLRPRLDHGVGEIARGFAAPLPAKGSTVFDCGANRAGVVHVRGHGQSGQTVTLRHCEILNPDGTPNYQSNRGAIATDEYVIGTSGEFAFEPFFTYHGFRYVIVETDARIDSVEWVALSSAREAALEFGCSNPLLTSMHHVSMRTAQSNLLSIPTDCPQRDERLGWTGDAQLYVRTGVRQFELFGFWSSWLSDVRMTAELVGAVPPLVPDIVRERPLSLRPGVDVNIYDRAGWADALVEVPFEMWRTGGDSRLIVESIPAIRQWIDRLTSRLTVDDLLPQEFQFGDWLDPQAPVGKPWLSTLSPQFVSNAYLVRSLGRVTEIERAFGAKARAESYAVTAERVRSALWSTMGPAAIERQGGCAMALVFDICPTTERAHVASELTRHVRRDCHRLGTGFLTTPLVLDALALNGYPEDAIRMVLNENSPSWAGQLRNGATTWWERWDALNSDGTIGESRLDGVDSGMISFNHLVNGTVASWIYERIAGIRLDFRGESPTVIFEPILSTAAAAASLAQQTPWGLFSGEWHLDSDSVLNCSFDVPAGLILEPRLPIGDSSEIAIDSVAVNVVPRRLTAGHHSIQATHPIILDIGSRTG